jgi:hypothetical protein
MTLRRRKEGAYAVDLELEDRTVYLQASPQEIAWDLHGDRLLYHRAEWHYRIIKGSNPEKIVDWGRVDTVICALAAAAGPLNDVAQGQAVALVASDPVTGNPGWSGPRIVEQIAADPADGSFVVYSHRDDVEEPYVTELAGFGRDGGMLSSASLPQPLDGTPRWHVPHAILHDGHLYAVERDDTTWPDFGPATGRIVRRIIGGLGGLTATLPLPAGERYSFPHTLALDPDTGTLFVFATRLNRFDWVTWYTTSLTRADAATLAFELEHPVDFGFKDFVWGDKVPYYLGVWESAGGPNTGGLCVFDGWDGSLARFVSSAIDPSRFDPRPWAPRYYATFRWNATTRGTWLASVGDDLPVPLHRSATGLIGAWQSSLPPAELEL